MSWDPKYSVNLEEIDSQHKQFFDLLERIERATKARPDHWFPSLIEALLRYTEFHFASEEALMSSYGYAGDAHRIEHKAIAARLEAMLNDTTLRLSSVRLFMYNWLVRHIQLEDVALAKFINNRRSELDKEIASALETESPNAPRASLKWTFR